MNERLLRWYGQVKRMANDILVRQIYGSTAKGTRRGRPRKILTDAARELIKAKDNSNEDTREKAGDWIQWKRSMYGLGVNADVGLT